MNKVVAFFKLIRWFNVLITGACVLLFQHFIINVNMQVIGSTPTLLWWEQILLALSVMCVMAAGNVVNDYFDFKQDKQFKPQKVILGKEFSLDHALYIIGGLNIVGIGLAFFLSWRVENMKLANVFLLSALLLWQYSATLKKYVLVGNLIVAGLCAFVFAIPVLFESQMFNPAFSAVFKNVVMLHLKGYAAFAFLTTLIREVVKDAEDYDADKAYGYKTLPVLTGLLTTRIVAVLLVMMLVLGIAFLMNIYWKGNAKNHFWYAALFLQFPLLVNIIPLAIAHNKIEFKTMSVIMKVVMVFGIVTLPVFYLFSL